VLDRNIFGLWLNDLHSHNSRYTFRYYAIAAIIITVFVMLFRAVGISSLSSNLLAILLVPIVQFAIFVWPLLIRFAGRRQPFPGRRKLVRSIVSIPEPIFLWNGVGVYPRLGFDDNLKRMISSWCNCTIDAHYFAIEGILTTGGEQGLHSLQGKTLTFLEGCYDTEKGFYRQGLWDGKSCAHYSHCAIGVLKSLSGIPCGEILGMRQATQYIGQKAERIAQNALAVAERILEGKLNGTGEESLTELYACYQILWNLGKEDLLLRSSRSSLIEFVMSLERRSPEGIGFAIERQDYRQSISGTYFAVRLLNAAGAQENLRMRIAERIRNYLDHCWNNSAGAFSSKPGGLPTIIHTRMVIGLYQFLGTSLTEDQNRRIISFVKSCKSRNLFAFHPGLVPNAYATRCALEILLRTQLGRVTEKQLASIREELIRSMYDRKNGVFLGYPISAI